ncbi:YfjI family protein [Elioraea rosea]|uniref:YfjI family protein n=1 Tax=Elioraea rosea TaxID=2492390 RepID=UPI0011820951|nr:YfjI family protein [Elioraea rosea]
MNSIAAIVREADAIAAKAAQSHADAPWPEPDWNLANDDPLPPPALPLDLFPAAWGDWMRAAGERPGAPVDYGAVSVLAAIGAAIGNRRWGQVREEWEHPPVLFAALVGEPSSNKSPAMRAVTKPMAEIEAALNDDWKDRQRDHATHVKAAKHARAKWENDANTALNMGSPPPVMPEAALDPETLDRRRLLVDSVTTERLAHMARSNPAGLLVASDELARFLGSMDRYGNKGSSGADRAFWLEAHGGGRFSVDRVGKDEVIQIVVPNLTVGILGGIQPDRLASAMLAGDDDGLASRFLFSWPGKVRPQPPIGASQRAFIASALSRLIALPCDSAKPVMLPFTREAEQRMDAWRVEVFGMENDAAGLFKSWIGKLPGQAVRLAVIFAHMEWIAGPEHLPPPAAIRVEDVEAAIALLVAYFTPMARRVFGASALPRAERDARTLAAWMLRQRCMPQTLNARALHRQAAGPAIPDPARITAALAELNEAGWVRPAPAREGDHPGKPRADFAVNPALRAGRA